MLTRAQAWAWYLDRRPDVPAVDGRPVAHLSFVPEEQPGEPPNSRCNSDACWCHVVPLLCREEGD